MKKLILACCLIIAITLPVMADVVVVEREKKNTEEQLTPQKSKVITVVPVRREPTEAEINKSVNEIKQMLTKNAKKILFWSDKKFDNLPSEEFCGMVYKLEDLGAKDIWIERFYGRSDRDETYKIGTKSFKNPYRCIKYSFIYAEKRHEAGACRFTPHNGLIGVN